MGGLPPPTRFSMPLKVTYSLISPPHLTEDTDLAILWKSWSTKGSKLEALARNMAAMQAKNITD